jgi:hypothetical protein
MIFIIKHIILVGIYPENFILSSGDTKKAENEPEPARRGAPGMDLASRPDLSRISPRTAFPLEFRGIFLKNEAFREVFCTKQPVCQRGSFKFLLDLSVFAE